MPSSDPKSALMLENGSDASLCGRWAELAKCFDTNHFLIAVAFTSSRYGPSFSVPTPLRVLFSVSRSR